MFILADGVFFIRKHDIDRYEAVLDKEIATEFSYKQAKSLINNKKAKLRWIKEYRMVNIVNGKILNNNYQGKEGLYDINNIKFDTELVENIISKANVLSSLENMSKEDLETYKTKLLDMVSYYDSALSDIRHFLDLYNLDAAKNSKIFKKQKEIAKK